jgi:hypothetical protein
VITAQHATPVLNEVISLLRVSNKPFYQQVILYIKDFMSFTTGIYSSQYS